MPVVTYLSEKLSDGVDDQVIVHDRNAIALAAVRNVLAADPNKDLTLLWGSGHLPGISDGLEEMGYRHTYKGWFSAFSLVAKP